jgi:hypothetical protein
MWGLVERESFIYQRLDWLTKFKLTQSFHRQKRELAPEMKKLIQACDWPELLLERTSPGLTLVETSLTLPTQGILLYEISNSDKSESWQNFLQVIKKLGAKSTQVFVPDSYKIETKTLEAFSEENIHFEIFKNELSQSPWNWN